MWTLCISAKVSLHLCQGKLVVQGGNLMHSAEANPQYKEVDNVASYAKDESPKGELESSSGLMQRQYVHDPSGDDARQKQHSKLEDGLIDVHPMRPWPSKRIRREFRMHTI
jgi:hypothetical protein